MKNKYYAHRVVVVVLQLAARKLAPCEAPVGTLLEDSRDSFRPPAAAAMAAKAVDAWADELIREHRVLLENVRRTQARVKRGSSRLFFSSLFFANRVKFSHEDIRTLRALREQR